MSLRDARGQEAPAMRRRHLATALRSRPDVRPIRTTIRTATASTEHFPHLGAAGDAFVGPVPPRPERAIRSAFGSCRRNLFPLQDADSVSNAWLFFRGEQPSAPVWAFLGVLGVWTEPVCASCLVPRA